MVLKKEDGKYVLYSKKNKKNLGTFKTKQSAINRERQINYFKHANK